LIAPAKRKPLYKRFPQKPDFKKMNELLVKSKVTTGVENEQTPIHLRKHGRPSTINFGTVLPGGRHGRSFLIIGGSGAAKGSLAEGNAAGPMISSAGSSAR